MHESQIAAPRRPADSVSAHRWWILCRVIDNFGDAGVCWRLARLLATEHGREVTLFIDRPELAHRLAGGKFGAVEVCDWPSVEPTARLAGRDPNPVDRGKPRPDGCLPDVLLSAFGCEPPDWLRAQLAARPARPLWINLEYLSAEAWVDGCHGLSSIKPDGAVEHFFYAGFSAATGGLLREHDALAPLPPPRGEPRANALAELCGQRPAIDERVISLFCYPDAPIADWLEVLASGPSPVLVLVPEGIAGQEIEARFGAPLPAGAPARQSGRLRMARLPFLPQPDYDRLLRLADLNFVRGEDSWVRAHWARRPFVWQPYRQQECTHLAKLDAFLTRLAAAFPAPDAGDAAALAATLSMMRAWSGNGDLRQAWQAFDGRLAEVARLFERWSDRVAELPELSTSLVDWAEHRL